MKITEQWLKDNGWKVKRYDTLPYKPFHYASKMFGKDKVYLNALNILKIYRCYEQNYQSYPDIWIDKMTTVEKLNAALELCEVTED